MDPTEPTATQPAPRPRAGGREGLLLGWFLASALTALLPERAPPALTSAAGVHPSPTPPGASRALGERGVRLLRSLPGVGARRAWAIQAATWAQEGDPEAAADAWRSVPGIGARTEQRILAHLRGLSRARR